MAKRMRYFEELDLRDKIISEIEMIAKFSIVPKEKPLKEGTVLDEEKSVKWNREQVEKSQENYKNEMDRLRNEKALMDVQLKENIFRYIDEEMDFFINDRQKNFIYQKAYETGHSGSSYEYLQCLDDYIDFINDFFERGK